MVLRKKRNKIGLIAVAAALNFLFFMPLNYGHCSDTAKAQAKKEQVKTSAQVSKGAVEKEKKKAEHIKEELNKKAIQAISETYKVVDLLEKNKSQEALELLKKVIGELEVILTANKDVSLIPINSYTLVYDTPLSPEAIKEEVKKAQEMLDDGNIQGARMILDSLRSEIDIIIENLPLATYPDAMKLASKYIIDNKIKEAQSVLSIALNSMVVKKIVIPIPLVRASDLIEEASKTAKTHKDQALKYLNEAKKQLRLAKTLGYGNEDQTIYKDLQTKIDKIKAEIKGNNRPSQMFEELLKKLKEFKKKLTSS